LCGAPHAVRFARKKTTLETGVLNETSHFGAVSRAWTTHAPDNGIVQIPCSNLHSWGKEGIV